MVLVVRSNGDNRTIEVGRNQTLQFTDTSDTFEICIVYITLNSGLIFGAGTFECDKGMAVLIVVEYCVVIITSANVIIAITNYIASKSNHYNYNC